MFIMGFSLLHLVSVIDVVIFDPFALNVGKPLLLPTNGDPRVKNQGRVSPNVLCLIEGLVLIFLYSFRKVGLPVLQK